MQHVDLYVNDYTLNLGEVGRNALAELSRRAASVGLGSGQPLDVLELVDDHSGGSVADNNA
jgi:1,4-dihydroxy-6-naphthoate synthase